MKKLGLVSALSLGLVLVAGCTTSKPVTITSSEDMLAVYNQSKAMTCTLESTSEEGTATSVMYFKEGMISQVQKIVSEGIEYNDYALARDGMLYGWGDSYGEGGMYMEYDIDVEKELGDFGELEEGTKLTCMNGIKNDSVFEKPSNIEFTSMNDLFGDMGEYYDEEYPEEYNEYSEEVVEENVEEVVEENVEEVVEENVEEVVE